MTTSPESRNGPVQFPQWRPSPPKGYPCLADARRVATLAGEIKAELKRYRLEALSFLLKNDPILHLVPLHSVTGAEIWSLATALQRYGAIYFISPQEARLARNFARRHRDLLIRTDEILRTNYRANRAWNYAVHRFVRAPKRHISLAYSKHLPPFAIATHKRNHISVRAEDYLNERPLHSLAEQKALADLHDFSHMVSASINHYLYGAKYEGLLALPKYLGRLIKPGYHPRDVEPIADPVVFSEISLHLFNQLPSYLTDNYLVNHISDQLFWFYRGERKLLIPSLGYRIAIDPLTPVQLAVLVQNKAYEASAAELETLLFVRGGAGTLDELAPLNAAERLERIADLTDRTYFERRNTIRHRAHVKAYQKYTHYLLRRGSSTGPEHQLLAAVDLHLRYEKLALLHEPNLFDKVHCFLNDT